MPQHNLIFTTPGTIDDLAITTLGVNAKLDASTAIGFFGTGLKYAIAGILRLGGSIDIFTDHKHLKFIPQSHEVRGQSFDVVVMLDHDRATGACVERRLGFTTDLGKNWQPWMFYRELWSNTLDEGGEVEIRDESCDEYLTQYVTTIVIKCPELLAVHHDRRRYFLDPARTILWHSDELEISAGPAPGIYYRGILVHEATTLFAYNLLQPLELTEDRTAKSYVVEMRIPRIMVNVCDVRTLVCGFVTAPKNSWETEYCDINPYTVPSPLFMEIVGNLRKSRHKSLRRDALSLWLRNRPDVDLDADAATLSRVEATMLKRALAGVAAAGITLDAAQRIVVLETLGEDVLGEAKNNTIYLSRRAFQQGTKMLAGTIVEEWVHLTHGHGDCTRGMQNWLLDKLMSMVEELRGEPL